MLRARERNGAVRHVHGVIEAIDLTGRSLKILVDGTPEVFDLSPDCPLVLHGELVKLRLLQPQDLVCINYTEGPDQRQACFVVVTECFTSEDAARVRQFAN